MSNSKKITAQQLNTLIGIGTGMVFVKGDNLLVPDFVKLLNVDINSVNKSIKDAGKGK